MSWQGKILRVDLTNGTCTPEPLNMEWANEYLGERGLATRYLMDAMDPAADAMSPENVLIFANGPLGGTMASTSGRYCVVTKGPLTNAVACSNSGGKFGAELKFAGYDMLIVTGKSETPVYLLIENEDVSIKSADHLWGKTVWDTEETLKSLHHSEDMKVASIGVAGEKGVYYACVVNDLHRAAGRSGVGAVMGSKGLKAVAVRGTTGVRVKDPVRFMKVVKEKNAKLWADPSRDGLRETGTLAMIDVMQKYGGLPTNNFQEVQFDGVGGINHKAVTKKSRSGHQNLLTNKACFGCTIACGRIAHIDKNHFSVVNRKEYWHASGGLEYETAFAFGPAVGVDDVDALTFAGYMMNEHGMDPISFGVTLAAAMELYELGILTKEQTDGIELKFGNPEALTVMAEKTGKYEGFGQDLALGSKRLCEKYGRPELAMVVKGQEFAGYDSRALQGMGLGYATSNRGACHLRHDTFTEDFEDIGTSGKAQACKSSQDDTAAVDSVGICLFTSSAWDIGDLADQLDAACEGEWTEERVRECGERTWTLERMFNLRSGLTAADDTLPPRMLNDPVPSGTAKGNVNELDKMLPEYYSLRDWTAEGVPTAALMQRLNLEGLGIES
jgi:aldehyde:ferredoxin oxidoreductase